MIEVWKIRRQTRKTDGRTRQFLFFKNLTKKKAGWKNNDVIIEKYLSKIYKREKLEC